MIHRERRIKTAAEVERLRIGNEFARFGLEAFRQNVVPGKSEIEVAAAVENEGSIHAEWLLDAIRRGMPSTLKSAANLPDWR